MTRYRSKSGKNSGVTGFEIGMDYIIVQFNFDEQYRYTYQSAGADAIEKMKSLAEKQKGLSTFISRNNPPYS
ncbi:MAG: hypothetical protein REI78_11795 [Pedobacter sp.]|nr:hypothetical protein [Pedobacter sp.]MDQ8053706.1 hypothetical protein [Pedobacter sp.]